MTEPASGASIIKLDRRYPVENLDDPLFAPLFGALSQSPLFDRLPHRTLQDRLRLVSLMVNAIRLYDTYHPDQSLEATE